MIMLAFFLLTQPKLLLASPPGPEFPWPHDAGHQTLVERFPPPPGFTRLELAANTMGSWLRTLPLLPEPSRVHLHDGREKNNQAAHVAIVDIDVGKRNLQQCADAVMRLRAEFLWAQKRQADIRFNFTSGHPAIWQQWQQGMRPRIQGNNVSWQPRVQANPSYQNFRRYLDTVFIYAGSASLQKELKPVSHRQHILPGDVFIQGGFPGHAVIVMDVAEDATGKRIFLLAQSYMPAQQIHILKQPRHSSPWYPAQAEGVLQTPEWRFEFSDLYRFEDR